MAPVGRRERTSSSAGRARRRGRRRDQLCAQRDDPRVARRRAGFDHQQRVAGLRPHQFGQRRPLGLADFADDVARDDEVGWFRLGELARASPARSGCRQTRAVSARSSASARRAALASSSVKSCSDGKARPRPSVAVPGPAPTSSRLSGAKSGRISLSASGWRSRRHKSRASAPAHRRARRPPS